MQGYKFAFIWFILTIYASFILIIVAEKEPIFLTGGFVVFVLCMLGIYFCIKGMNNLWMEE